MINKKIILNNILLMVLLFFYTINCGCTKGELADEFGLVIIKVKDTSLKVEIANTPEKKQLGLMYREKLPQNRGMLFIFDNDQIVSFWMKNTRIPLSIAYIEKNGTIVKIQDMRPYSEKHHSSESKVRYALEVNKGWFDKHGIESSDTVIIPEIVTDK